MEDRKQKEIDYYNKEAAGYTKEAGSHGGFNPFLLSSYRALEKNGRGACQGKRVLDYGCGHGLHLSWLGHIAREVVGVDLSEKSLEQTRQKIQKEQLSNVTVQVDDCEKLSFSDNSFDVVFDGGTFSSLDLDIALAQIHRVLKPGGFLFGIETLGHNPLTNFKRKINKFFGKRTSWAESHIFRIEDLERVKKYFNIKELRFFHVTSWAAFPFLRSSGGKLFLKLLEKLDHFLLNIFPFLKRYSFKIVFVLTKK